MQTSESKLKEWASRQRKAYCDGTLSKAHVRKLESAGFVFNPRQSKHKAIKDRILSLARTGLLRLGKKDSEYVTMFSVKGRKCYDQDFTQELRALKPQWIPKLDHTVSSEMKPEIIAMAEAGLERPNSKKTVLGRTLVQLTCKTSPIYDYEFDQLIRQMAPTWFERNSSAYILQRKQEILRLAEAGMPKPNMKHPLYPYMRWYLNKGCHCFDPVFRGKVESIRPDWFKHT